jgi:N,N-dimethylformamidase
LVGYLDRFSARPGERIEIKVSSTLAEPYQADLVRIIHGGANPAGPGIKLIELPSAFAGSYSSRFQPVHQGSCGVAIPAASLAFPDPCTIVVRVQPWLLDRPPQFFRASGTADGHTWRLRRCAARGRR